jgi:hypothetical protein
VIIKSKTGFQSVLSGVTHFKFWPDIIVIEVMIVIGVMVSDG